MSQPIRTPNVVIVGAGPSGLRAATELATVIPGQVLVLDRESEPGGIPRHCFHPGYGMRDIGRFSSGPSYARTLAERAHRAGAEIVTNAMVTGFSAETGLMVTSPGGCFQVQAKATIWATGARERPRAARRIAGDRPAGIYTTGQLQNLVHLHHQKVGRKAVIVGAEMVSWSAALTLRYASCQTVLMTTKYPAPDVYRFFSAVGRPFFGTKVATTTVVRQVIGHRRVEGVEIEHLETGQREIVACDTVVFTGDWIPDNELVRAAGLTLDVNTLGPAVDTALRTDREGVFAIGNLVHPVSSADVAALDGRHVAPHVLNFLAGNHEVSSGTALAAGRGFKWISPSRFLEGDQGPSRGMLLLWPTELHPHPTVVASQAGQKIGKVSTWWPAAPGRIYCLPYRILERANPTAGPVTISIPN